MKRKDLIRHIERQGDEFLREGRRYTVYHDPLNKKTTTVPRHREIHDFLAAKICKDLEIASPK